MYRKSDDVHEKTVGEVFFLFKPGLDGFYGFSGVGAEIWAAVIAGQPPVTAPTTNASISRRTRSI